MGLFNVFKSESLRDVAKPVTLDEIKKRAKIVIIDDDPDALPIKFLKDEHYSVEVWETVKNIDILERATYDIIVLDIGGVAGHIDPEEDGFAVLKALKANSPNQLIIACSGQQFDSSKHEFFKLADDVLSKPVTPEAAKRKLDRLLHIKFDLFYHWKCIADTLAQHGVSDRIIRKLEHHIASSIRKSATPNIEGKFGSTFTPDVLAEVISVSKSILTIAAAFA